MTENPGRLAAGEGDHYRHSRSWPVRALMGRASFRVRRQVVATLMRELRPGPTDRILDIGVTGDTEMVESNAFEHLYPFPERVTGLGIGSLAPLKNVFPAMRFVQGDALVLPFGAGAFDIAVTHATIEHVGGAAAQAQFLMEVLRVSRRSFVTTPNRWFPLELHTMLPLLHYLPVRAHRAILKRLGFHFYADERRLSLLTPARFRRLFPPEKRVRVLTTPLRSNLMAIVS